MRIELVYALPDEQNLETLEVADDCTIAQAISQSGILQRYPMLETEEFKVGIFSKIVELDHILKAGDRIEIYRDLVIDPKEARRLRAKKR